MNNGLLGLPQGKLTAASPLEADTLGQQIDDRVQGLLQAGDNVTLTYNDAANTLTIDATSGTQPLYTNLVSFWGLNETSGNRIDAIGSNDFTSINGVTSVAGQVGNAAQFSYNDENYLQADHNSTLNLQNTPFTLSLFLGPAYFDEYGGVLAKGYEFQLVQQYINEQPDGAQVRFNLFDNGSSTSFGEIAFTTLQENQWNHLLIWHNPATKTVSGRVNLGATISTSYTTQTLVTSNAPLQVGCGSFGVDFLNGKVDCLGLWHRVLTEAEQSDLYNDGQGLELLNPPSPSETLQTRMLETLFYG